MHAERARGVFEIADREGRNEDQGLKEGSNGEWQVSWEPAKGEYQNPQDPDSGKNETSEDDRAE
jgi:hypothetical protein